MRQLEARILCQDSGLRPSPPRTKLGPVPVPMTEMLGRDALLESVLREIRAHRLVTLLGPGGVGKTRLALAAAGRWLRDHENGVAFADATRAEDRHGLRLALMSALGIGQSGDDAADFAGADRDLLLICDNLEQVVDEADLLLVLLQSAPAIRVLVTSRVRLELPAEQLVEVAPLPVDADPSTPRDDSGTPPLGAAVDLFLRRAREAAPAVELTGDALPSVVTLVRSLDGLPLALELAAARIRTFSPAQIHSRLADLVTGQGARRGAPAHQASLRATVDWSLRLLSPAARLAFTHLWVFGGGFTLEAAEQVAADPADPMPVSAWLSELVEASLLQPVEGRAGRRFVMFETLRLRSRSLEDDSVELERRLAEYLVELASPGPAVMYGPQAAKIQLRLKDELPNWISAVERAVRAEPATALRLIVSWRPIWIGWPPGVRPLARALLWLAGTPDLDDADRSLAALSYGVAQYLQGAVTEAVAQLEVEVPRYASLRPADEMAVRGWCWLAAARCDSGTRTPPRKPPRSPGTRPTGRDSSICGRRRLTCRHGWLYGVAITRPRVHSPRRRSRSTSAATTRCPWPTAGAHSATCSSKSATTPSCATVPSGCSPMRAGAGCRAGWSSPDFGCSQWPHSAAATSLSPPDSSYRCCRAGIDTVSRVRSPTSCGWVQPFSNVRDTGTRRRSCMSRQRC